MNIPQIEKGKIYIFGNWKFPIIENLNIDLFWNAASFQEMEPDVVANYLKYVNTQAKYVYLYERMDGKELASELKGGGVLQKTTIKEYINGLNNFILIDISRAIRPKYKFAVNTFFKKRRNSNTVKAYSKYPSVKMQKAISTKNYRESFWIHV